MKSGGDLATLKIESIIADGDLDGLVAASILCKVWPDANVHFSHPAELRGGFLDDSINERTAICDLPFHPRCGLFIDHHQTNRPSAEEEKAVKGKGCVVVWRDAPSAARVAFDLFREQFDLSSIEPMMEMVDKLDSGGISRDEFLSNDPIVWLSRTISSKDQEYSKMVAEALAGGASVDDVVKRPEVVQRIDEERRSMDEVKRMLESHGEIKDRLAIVRLEDTGYRTNGYLVTAHYGDDCDACLIVHGSSHGNYGSEGSWPLSASFYTNSFLHSNGGVFDLTRMATRFDVDGGGHYNACGCRIMPLGTLGDVEHRATVAEDIGENIRLWLQQWSAAQASSLNK